MQGYTGKYSPSVGEGHISILPWHYSSIVAGTWAIYTDSNQWLLGAYRNTTHNDSDEINYKVYLDAGTYSIRLFGITGNSYGIIDILLDAVSQGTQDWYSASGVYNVSNTTTGVSVTTPGLKTLGLKLNGKNASSSDHYIYLTTISLWRTA